MLLNFLWGLNLVSVRLVAVPPVRVADWPVSVFVSRARVFLSVWMLTS